MSIEIMSAVWRESNSTGRARLVLLAIADMQGEIGAWPSIATLATMVNSSERSVQRDIKYLEEIGELIVLERQAPTRAVHKSNLYWVNLPSTSHLHMLDDEVTNSVDEVTNQRHEVTNRDDEVTTGGVISITRTITEPLKNYMPKSSDDGFQEFWDLYPRKNGRSDAVRAFRKALKVASFDTILAGVVRFADDPNKPAKQYLPYPATWLNREGWEDEPYPVRVLSREEQLSVSAERARRQLDSSKADARKAIEEAQEARRRAEENPVESCPHRAVKLLCKICG